MGAKYHYNCTNLEVLTVAETITNHCIDNTTDLVKEKPAMQDPYFPNLLKTIQDASANYLGIDISKGLRAATISLRSIMTSAKEDLTKFKTNLAVDFKKDKTRAEEILNTLGFKKFYKTASNNNQEDMISLLNQFKNNLTAELETEVVAKGTNPELLTRLKGYAGSLSAANITQETEKGNRPAVTAEAVNTFNEIYDEVIGNCKIAQNIFKNDKTKKDLFSFAKALSALRGGNHSAGGNSEDPAPPPAN